MRIALTPLGMLPSADVSTKKPLTLILPMALAKQLKIDRRLVITKRDQQVPGAVIDWMRGDPRYVTMFPELVVAPSEDSVVMALDGGIAAQTDNETPPNDDGGAETPPSDTDKGNGEPIPEGDKWRADWTAPKLHEYAEQFKVELPAKAKKEDVITALRDRRGEFEDTSEPEPTKGE